MYVCRLSCQIRTNNATVNASQNLVLPGNKISASAPDWEPTRQVSFLSVSEGWEQWRQVVIDVTIGTSLGLPLLLYTSKGALACLYAE